MNLKNNTNPSKTKTQIALIELKIDRGNNILTKLEKIKSQVKIFSKFL